MSPDQIGKYIAKKRKERKITQKEFAEKLGITDKTISRWENGHYMPDISLLNDIALILNVSIAELLNGEDGKKENMDESITKIVEVSKQNIIKSKRNLTVKGIIILLITILILGTISFYCIKKYVNKNQQNVEEYRYEAGAKSRYGSSIGVIEKDDGWSCKFNLEYDNSFKEITLYGYVCDNFKYEEIEDFHMTNGAEKEYLVKFNHPTTMLNENYRNDSKNVHEYFMEHKFKDVITIDDLDKLEVKLYKKEDILATFNKAITGEKISTLGNYHYLNDPHHLLKSERIDGLQYFVGYYLNQGHIAYVSIELKINDEYLSDKVKNNTANEDEKNLYEKLKQTEEYIIKTQTFWHKEHFDREDKRLRLLDLVFYKINTPEKMLFENIIWMEGMPSY